MRKKVLTAVFAFACFILLMGLTQAAPDWNISPVPKGIPSIGDGNWEKVLKLALDSFYSKSKEGYHFYSQVNDRKKAVLVMGLLYSGNLWEGVPEDLCCSPRTSLENCPNPKLKKAVFETIHTAKYRQIAYPWASAYFNKAFLALPKEEQLVWREIVDYAVDLLRHYDYKKELAYYQRLKATPSDSCGLIPDRDSEGRCTETWKFIDYKPDGTYHHYRKLDAFIFRRIHNNELSLADMQLLARMLSADLKKIPVKAD
ncbi:MAG: hypothetical protein NTZ49_01400 [Candidatus Parcubacteria bacterium]|nr:hypothetical protein [Candidatus Parcubacteria bacterium]